MKKKQSFIKPSKYKYKNLLIIKKYREATFFFHKNIKRGKRSYIKEILNLSD